MITMLAPVFLFREICSLIVLALRTCFSGVCCLCGQFTSKDVVASRTYCIWDRKADLCERASQTRGGRWLGLGMSASDPLSGSPL